MRKQIEQISSQQSSLLKATERFNRGKKAMSGSKKPVTAGS